MRALLIAAVISVGCGAPPMAQPDVDGELLTVLVGSKGICLDGIDRLHIAIRDRLRLFPSVEFVMGDRPESIPPVRAFQVMMPHSERPEYSMTVYALAFGYRVIGVGQSSKVERWPGGSPWMTVEMGTSSGILDAPAPIVTENGVIDLR